MRIALAQINSTTGDFKYNAEKILEYCYKAQERRAEIVVFPELSLFGYWPSDLLERHSLIEAQLKELECISKKIPASMAILIGAVSLAAKTEKKAFHNSAALLQRNKKTRWFHKELLPSYDVFDEKRHFSKSVMEKNIFSFKGKKILLTICEDIWPWGEAWIGTRYPDNPFKRIKKLNKKLDVIINMSSSPYSHGKWERRQAVVGKTAQYLSATCVYVNRVGAQDEIIFDGGSFVVNKKGIVVAQSSYFKEDINIFDTVTVQGGFRDSDLIDFDGAKKSKEAITREALVLGIRDFCRKIGINKVHLGLSGGIDSALVACLAVDALGPNNVCCIAMPSLFNAKESLSLAKSLSENLGCKFLNIEISKLYHLMLSELKIPLGMKKFNITNENMQARIRGNILMAYSNQHDSLLLQTGNKSEFATGYCTLYGDMNGGLSVIGDLFKTEVIALSKYYNKHCELIPCRIIERPPSAELRPNQKDNDSLPDYKELDKALHKIIVECKPARSKIEKWVLDKIYKTEFKRWQAPPILRVSQHAFGSGRRYPIAHRSKH